MRKNFLSGLPEEQSFGPREDGDEFYEQKGLKHTGPTAWRYCHEGGSQVLVEAETR